MQKLKQKLGTRGSILAFTLIILGLMLVIAIGIASVTIQERNSASTGGASTQAFQVADSGVELVIQKIKQSPTDTVDSLKKAGTTCADGTITMDVGISGGSTKITFYKDDNNAPATCGDLLASVKKVKSVGTFASASRAIEAAVAASNDNNGNSCDWLELGPEKSATTLENAIKNCRDETTGGSDWYLPTAEELACFIDTDYGVASAWRGIPGSVSSSYLLTRTPTYTSNNGFYGWAMLRLLDGFWTNYYYSTDPVAFRCVR